MSAFPERLVTFLKSPMDIVGDNFYLRPFQMSDIDALVRNINSSHVADRVENVPHPYTEADAIAWIAQVRNCVSIDQGKVRRIDFAIDVGGEVIGSIAFINVNGHKAQISYWLGKDYQHQGYMTEALKLIIRFGLDVCGFIRIWGYIWEGNEASRAALERVGFKREGVMENEWIKKGEIRNSHIYAICVPKDKIPKDHIYLQ